MEQLVQSLIQQNILKTPRIIEAFRVIDRKDFVSDEYEDEAYVDTALPISEGQTISQPYTVAFMLELLQPEKGNKIIDVGSGSLWQTALLAHIACPPKPQRLPTPRLRQAGRRVGKCGKVFGIERIPEVKKMGDENIAKYNFAKKGIVTNLEMNAENGIPQEAPFDRIIAGASGERVPDAWKEQLKIGGRIVAPLAPSERIRGLADSIHLLIKKKDGTFHEQIFPGFAFVPFVTKKK